MLTKRTMQLRNGLPKRRKQRQRSPLLHQYSITMTIILPFILLIIFISESLSLIVFAQQQEDDNNERYLLGNFTTRSHNVTGTVYVVSGRIIEIEVRSMLFLVNSIYFLWKNIKASKTKQDYKLRCFSCFRDLHTTVKVQLDTFTLTKHRYLISTEHGC